MKTDIRDIRGLPHIGQEDVLGLNFIRHPNPYVFRRHYRQGLRSHVMEVLDPEAVQRENEGIDRDGVRWFPKAVPLRVLRIFRTHFSSLAEALEETERFKTVKSYITADYLAVSEEFITDYTGTGTPRIILCGLQDYITGQVLDPWTLTGEKVLETLFGQLHTESPALPMSTWVSRIQRHTDRFVTLLRRMILEARLIPDLAGAGNLILTPGGMIKLVDINNIRHVPFSAPPPRDEKGYPTCDKSIEALSRIESRILGKTISLKDPIYRHFLTPERMAAVAEISRKFHVSL